jgi:uncharacterized protein YraI
VKCTLVEAVRDVPAGAATASMNTVPVNQSAGPGVLSSEFLVICIGAPLLLLATSGCTEARRRP